MKRFLALLLTVVMVFALAGCAGDKPAEDPVVESGESTEEPSVDPVEVSAEDMIVGFIYVGPIGDGGWTYSHDLGRLYLEDQLGVKTIYKESVPETQEVESEIRNMIDQGATAIFATSFGFMDYVEKMSKEFPDVAFFHCSGYKTTDNMANYFGRMYEARYLSGIAAALKTETNKLGYVAAFDIPEVIRGINAFALGAQSVNPEVEVEVVWTYTWYDPAIEKSAAIALLDGGADIIAQHQDTTGPQQAAEERGSYSIGYNTDMSEMAPEAYITAPIWNWGPYYVEQVQAVMDGSFESHAYWGEIEDGIVALAPLTENAAEGTADAISEAEAKIIDNSLHVFTGPIFNQAGEVAVEEGKIMTDDEMLNMKWFVQGVKGEISE